MLSGLSFMNCPKDLTLNVNEPGTYTLMVTDTTNGCIGEDTIKIVDDSDSFPYTIESIDGGQTGEEFGKIRVTYDNTYSGTAWSVHIEGYKVANDTSYTIQGAQSAEFIAPFGFYGIRATNDNCCEEFQWLVVNPIGCTINGQITTTPASCLGADDGTLIVNFDGNDGDTDFWFEFDPDNPNDVYQIGNYQSGTEVNRLPASNLGVYGGGGKGVAHIQDEVGCSFAANFEIEGGPTLGVTSCPNDMTIQCDDGTTGEILLASEFVVNQSRYDFLWSTGDTSVSVSNLSAGEYWVMATNVDISEICDEQSLPICTDTFFFEVFDPVPITSYFKTEFDPQGIFWLTAQVTGGTAPYSYNWTDKDGNVIGQTQMLEGRPCGHFLLEIIDDKGCKGAGEIFLLNGEEVSIEVQPPSCFDSADGAAFWTQGPVELLWSTGETSSEIHGLAAGEYSITVTTDPLSDCIVIIPFTVSVREFPNPINSYSDANGIIIHHDTTGSMMPFFNVAISIQGLHNNFDTSFVNTSGANTIRVEVPAGDYEVVITDLESGCNYKELVSVNMTACNINANITSTAISCLGANDGSIIIIVDPNDDFKFLLEVYNSRIELIFTDDNFLGGQLNKSFAPGHYFLKMVDSSGCSMTYDVWVDGPCIAGDYSFSGCNGDNAGEASIIVDNLGPSFISYLWSTGDTTRSIQGIPAGDYSVIVTDDMGCSETLFVPIEEPDPLTASETVSYDANEEIYDISLEVTGGTAPYSYTWANEDGILSDEILDHIRVGAGCYFATITDAEDCESTIVIKVGTTSATDLSKENDVILFPNPTKGNVNLAFKSVYNGTVEIQAFDIEGRLIFQEFETIKPGDIISFQAKNFIEGLSFVKIILDKTIITKRLMVSQ